MTDRRPYEAPAGQGHRRSAPAALRNMAPMGDVLAEWLPARGTVLELASGTGEHALAFARRFPQLDWQPSDIAPEALRSVADWRQDAPGNLRAPVPLDVAAGPWPQEAFAAMLAINLLHISPWETTLGLLDGAARGLAPGAPLILYGPWIEDEVETAPSNLAFDADLRRRDPRWGLRRVADLRRAADARGLALNGRVAMPANNIMLRLRRG